MAPNEDTIPDLTESDQASWETRVPVCPRCGQAWTPFESTECVVEPPSGLLQTALETISEVSMKKPLDPGDERALFRYQVISAYLALDPPRGQRRVLLEQLAARSWTGPDGEPVTVAAETIRAWVRQYRRHGFAGLTDTPRLQQCSKALNPELIELLCELKKDVPTRSVRRIIVIAERTGLVPEGVLKRSTVYRALREHGLSHRRPTTTEPSRRDLDRFEADRPNDLWQSDMLVGPWLPDPQKTGKRRRAYLYAFLDDHSRLLLYGRFSFKGDLPALELVFRRSLQRYGIPTRVYYDNGQVYRSKHMRQAVAHLGMHRIIHTRPYRPMGHGKIEAFNKRCRAEFLAELSASGIDTLDGINDAFQAWLDIEYNRGYHSEIGQTPLERWKAGQARVRFADEHALQQAFLWKETRSADKTGVFSFFGARYQVGAELAGRRFQIRYDPESLFEVDIWRDGAFVQRARPLEVQSWRRPTRSPEPPSGRPKRSQPKPGRVDWLEHLVQERRQTFGDQEDGAGAAEALRKAREEADDAIVALLQQRLPAVVFEPDAIRAWLDVYGPLEPGRSAQVLDELLDGGRVDAHVSVTLDAIRHAHRQGGDS